ncbi:MAG: hypothetical protein KGN36_01025 [Acidobacteriota bacterium]|nr:hypothetical protein [Acidobacteriota bacterium]
MSTGQLPLREPGCVAESEIGQREVRDQLNRLLVHPNFRNSRRYPALLRYVVEKTLAGQTDSLKERTLGVEVFGRNPDYDTSEDHIVRSTAAEVRKRLTQYYREPGHLDQIRIELLSGSYVPQFQWPTPECPATDEDRPGDAADAPEARPSRPHAWAVGAVLVTLLILLLTWSGRGRVEASSTPIERFWMTAFKSSGTIAMFTGDPLRAYTPDPDLRSTPPSVRTLLERNVPFSDAVTLTRLGALFSQRGKEYRVVYGRTSTLEDLRQGPAVLIGGVDNYWAVRLTSDLRFRFLAEKPTDRFTIEDSATGKVWRPVLQAGTQTTIDYGLITRVRHPTTGQIVVIAGGIQEYGTLAAGEFLTSGPALAELEHLAPKGWDGVNVQAVLSTDVLRNSPSPPKIVVAHFW